MAEIQAKLTQYDVHQEVGEFLDTIPSELRKKAVEEYKKFLHLKYLMKDTEIPAILSPRYVDLLVISYLSQVQWLR